MIYNNEEDDKDDHDDDNDDESSNNVNIAPILKCLYISFYKMHKINMRQLGQACLQYYKILNTFIGQIKTEKIQRKCH